MTNDEFGMSNWLNFGLRNSAFALPPAIAIMLEKHGIPCDMLHGSEWHAAAGDGKKTLFALPALQEHVLELEDGKTRWNQVIEGNDD